MVTSIHDFESGLDKFMWNKRSCHNYYSGISHTGWITEKYSWVQAVAEGDDLTIRVLKLSLV